MITYDAAMEIAHKAFWDEFGSDFFRKNLSRLTLCWEELGNNTIFEYGMAPKPISEYDISDGHGGIVVNDTEFPETVFIANVDLRTGSVKKEYVNHNG